MLFPTSHTSPRLRHCPCTADTATTFSPLTALLSKPTAPELLFIETQWASLVSYGLTVQALKDFLPVDASLSVSTVTRDEGGQPQHPAVPQHAAYPQLQVPQRAAPAKLVSRR